MNIFLRLLLISFILLDTGYSFMQHFRAPLDGDLAPIVVPSESYSHVLSDPFGISALTEGKKYAATNRFFVHWAMSSYFKEMPGWLQNFLSPLNSVYAASAIFKTMVQLLLAALLATCILFVARLPRSYFLPALAILLPFFQTAGYSKYLSIILASPTYTFFYAAPFVLLLLFLLPFIYAASSGQTFHLNGSRHAGLLLLVIVLPFSGPLIPALLLLICPAWLLYYWFTALKNQSGGFSLKQGFRAVNYLPKPLLFYFVLAGLLSLYSLYIGRFNAENDAAGTVSLGERYQFLVPGLIIQLTRKLAFPLLLLMIAVNTIILKRQKPESRRFVILLKWISGIAAAYLLLLPLGGYRAYREYLIRGDTFMPVTLAMIFFFGATTLYLLKNLKGRNHRIYAGLVILILALFTNADRPDSKLYDCERDALEKLSRSAESVLKLDNDCPVMGWRKIEKPEESDVHAVLLQHWGITQNKTLYYQMP